MLEIWRDIKNYEGIYEVSNLGRIKSISRNGTIKENRILKPNKVMGYSQVGLQKYGTRKYKKIHRLVAEAFIPNPENKKEVNHKDGIKTNNVLSNLEWCTRSENIIHAFDHNLAKSGEDHPNAIHSNAEVAEICKYIKYDNMNAKQISEALNVEYNTNFRKFVNRIRIGRSWKRIYDSV